MERNFEIEEDSREDERGKERGKQKSKDKGARVMMSADWTMLYVD